jgi:glycosyltransferase involved in cell wall biosynthesis
VIGDQAGGGPSIGLASSWYARMLGDGLVDLEALIEARVGPVGARAIRRLPWLRGVLIWLLAGPVGALVLTRGEPGAMTAIALAAWVRRRRVVVLELIRPPPARSRWRRVLRAGWWHAIERPAMRRALVGAQVLTASAREDYSRLYGIAADRFQHLPWAWSRDPSEPTGPARTREGVLSSGRAACDWETLFAAAAGRDWPLTVVCGDRDVAAVRALNGGGRARVRCEIPRREHDELMRAAAVYVIALADHRDSAGQVRLMTATQARTPVVASAVAALDGYAIDRETALLVPPEDPEALRGAIERLLADPATASRLAASAFARGRRWTYPQYFEAVRELIGDAIAGRPLPARAPSAPAG